MAEAQAQRYPALAAALLLHAGVLALALLTFASHPPIGAGNVVPVTLMTSADLPAPAPAVAAPEPAPAATPAPVPQAPPQPQAPEAPPPPPAAVAKQVEKPHPTPKPAPAPTPTVQPTKPAKASPGLDLNALAASLSAASRSTNRQPSSARQGPSRPQTALQTSTSPGTSSAATAAALNALGSELQRLWRPNCPDAARLTIQVSFSIGSNGHIVQRPHSPSDNSADPVLRAATEAAERAVYADEPFDNEPPSIFDQSITATFHGKSACANS